MKRWYIIPGIGDGNGGSHDARLYLGCADELFLHVEPRKNLKFPARFKVIVETTGEVLWYRAESKGAKWVLEP